MQDAERLRKSTLCLLVREGRMLLAMKKRGFGAGKLNGVGGKQKEGESIEGAAVRETREEIGVVPTSMEKVGIFNFYFPEAPKERDWDQQVHVFLVREWKGAPKETEEMKPEWFGTDKIPFDRMWDDDVHWLPLVLRGIRVRANFFFDKEQRLTDFKMEEVSKL